MLECAEVTFLNNENKVVPLGAKEAYPILPKRSILALCLLMGILPKNNNNKQCGF